MENKTHTHTHKLFLKKKKKKKKTGQTLNFGMVVKVDD